MAYDNNSPAQGHQALSDIDIIRNNTNELRKFEASASTAPPSNPVAGQFWWTTDTKTLYQRKQDNSAWDYIWSETDRPAKSSDLSTHIANNITNAVAVHGIKQGSGNGFDADKLDGYEASAFLGASHAQASSGVHGVGAGEVVGTTLTQTLTNKTINGGSIGSNISVNGAFVDGRDPSVDGAKLDTYPGNGAPANGTVTNAKLNGGQFTFNMPITLFPSTSYATIYRFKMFVPEGVAKLCVNFNVKGVETGQNIYMRLVNGGAVGPEAMITANNTWQDLNVNLTPAVNEKGTFGTFDVQGKNPNTSYSMYAHHTLDTTGSNIDMAPAATFIDI